MLGRGIRFGALGPSKHKNPQQSAHLGVFHDGKCLNLSYIVGSGKRTRWRPSCSSSLVNELARKRRYLGDTCSCREGIRKSGGGGNSDNSYRRDSSNSARDLCKGGVAGDVMMHAGHYQPLHSRRGFFTAACALAGVYCFSSAGASVCEGSSGTTATAAVASGGGGPDSSGTGKGASLVPGGRLPPLFTSVQASKGHRSYMEDDWYLNSDGRFAAVYDGHGGAAVSKYLRQNLYAQVQAHLPQEADDYGSEHVEKALKSAFEKIDEEVLQVRHWSYQGSTAVAVVIHPGREEGETGTIVTANVGDSRAVLSRRGKAIDLTQDHKPNSTSELKRVERLGGNVRWYGFFDPEGQPIEGTGVYRINGNLAVSRAVGDRSERPFVSGECDIRTLPMDKEGDQFIIIATDGLWDVMTSEEAVQHVQAVMGGVMGALREGETTPGGGAFNDLPVDVKLSDWAQRYADDRGMIRAAMMTRKKKMARYLTQEAIRRGTMDNVCAIVIWL